MRKAAAVVGLWGGARPAASPGGAASWRYWRETRGFSSGAQEVPSLKELLRAFYKKIHPDLLHDFPEERLSNERSFQVVQEYLSELQDGPQNMNFGSPRLYHFCFFVRQRESEGQTSGSPLHKVEITLPPPQRSRSAGGELPLTTRLALGRLFEACGLSGDFLGGLKGDERIRLSNLFRQALEIQRSGNATATSAERHVIIVRNALRMGRGVVATFRSPIADARIENQIEFLERLGRALDKVPDLNLAGCSMVVGNGYGIDPLGNIWLDHQDEAGEWAQWLPQVSVDKARERRKAAEIRRGHEFLTARAMELEMVYTDDATSVLPEYAELLRQLVAWAEEKGALRNGRFQELPVRIVNNKTESSYHSESRHSSRREGDVDGNGEPRVSNGMEPLWSINQSMGFITVPLTASPDEIYRFIESEGDKALVYRERYKREEKRLQDAISHVRSKLRLRHLACDDKISTEQFLAACARMLRYAPELQTQMEGLSVCISDEHRLPIIGVRPMLHMKWNFSVADL